MNLISSDCVKDARLTWLFLSQSNCWKLPFRVKDKKDKKDKQKTHIFTYI